MSQSLHAISLILNMNTRLFVNALSGVTEEQSAERATDHSNPMRWIAPHTVSSRYLALLCLGKPATDPYQELFGNFRGYDASLNYPTLEETKAEWEKVSALLRDALASATDEILAADCPIKTPTGDFTNLGTLTFIAQHESYDIGQMGFLKKYLTMEAMKY